MKKHLAEKRRKRAKTFEEIDVETALLLGFIPAFVLLAILVLFTPTIKFLVSLGPTWMISGIVFTLVSLIAICSVFLGLRFHFSHRQFSLLGKFLLAICGGGLAFFVAYSYVLFTLLYDLISNPNFPAVWMVSALNLIIIGLLILFKKMFGEQISQWFRIKYVPGNASLELASKSLKKAEQELARKNYEGAGEEFHSAAVMYVNLEKWREAGENYARAAEACSMERGMAFGASFMYGLTAAAFLLNGNIEDAKKAVETGNKILETEKMPDKAKQRASYILTFLKIISDGDTEKAEEFWKSIRRKVTRWGYPITEETIILMEKTLETLKHH